MKKFNAKVLQEFHLNSFSGGINTDSEASIKELLQCKNLIIDSKGKPKKRGGSKVINPFAPIGKRAIKVWGYLFGYLAGGAAYESDFVAAQTIVASSVETTNPTSNIKDLDGATAWKMKEDKAVAATASASSSSGAYLPANMIDENASTYWKAVI